MLRRRAPLAVLPLLVAGACSLNHPSFLAPADGAPDALADAALDVAPDAPVDARPDAPVDAPPLDVLPDVPVDAPVDALPDVPVDAAPDAPVDAPDAAPDAPPDVAPDTSPDVAPDTSPDAPPDVPVDVGPDVVCSSGRSACGTTCVDLMTDNAHCGRCDSPCTAPETCIGGSCACAGGRRFCAGTCVDVRSDNAHCGACGNACVAPETCQDGACGCPGAQTACAGGCVNTATDPSHCGRCNYRCGEGTCAAGACACAAGLAWCAMRCVNLQTDAMNCGACGNACAMGVCTAGSCGPPPITCTGAVADCNGNRMDGCEVDTSASVQNCGRCGSACAPGQRCVGGACAVARSCAEIHRLYPSLPSAEYPIRPDGAPTPVTVWCDMDTGGGGWTVVYLWPNAQLQSTSLNYDVDLPALRAASTEVLLAYRNAARRVTDASWARLTLPPAWVTQSPFRYEQQELNVMVSVADAAPVATRLKYGYREFGSDCASGWVPGLLSGRVCFTGTRAPFFNGYATSRYDDRCPNSDQRWDGARCSDGRRFSIAVR